jgi:hypothetical protein
LNTTNYAPINNFLKNSHENMNFYKEMLTVLTLSAYFMAWNPMYLPCSMQKAKKSPAVAFPAVRTNLLQAVALLELRSF